MQESGRRARGREEKRVESKCETDERYQSKARSRAFRFFSSEWRHPPPLEVVYTAPPLPPTGTLLFPAVFPEKAQSVQDMFPIAKVEEHQSHDIGG